MNVCIIPARGGSKRIPRKNIKLFQGKPIIAYSIEAALKSGCFDKIIVSTDDEEIAQVARDFGAETPFLRPAELAGDYAGTLPVIKHAVEWLEENSVKSEFICCIYATAPFITSRILFDAYQRLRASKGAQYCLSVSAYSSPVQRAFTCNASGRIKMLYPDKFNKRSQDLEDVYFDAGQFYWGTAKAFKDMLGTFGRDSIPFELPKLMVHDIDTPDDWRFAEILYQTNQGLR